MNLLITILTINLLVFISQWFLIPKEFRSIFLLIVSFLFIAFINLKIAIYYLFNIFIVFYIAKIINLENKDRILLLRLTLLWLVGNLCLFKVANYLPDYFKNHVIRFSNNSIISFDEVILPLGISYIVFRLIHYIVEVYKKNISPDSILDLALYVLFFPTYLAGPVDRYQRFAPQIKALLTQAFNLTSFNNGLYRISIGLIKKFIIADSLSELVLPIIYEPDIYSKLLVVFSVYALYLVIYLDFSGYTDIALGISKLYGFKIVENFNKPYLQKNIAMFWRNWHISVYSWIRDYFFLPFFAHKPSNLKIYIGIFFTMLVFMLWHEVSESFFLLGFYHGIGFVLWQFFQDIKRKFPVINNYLSCKWLDYFSRFITITFCSFGFLFFPLDNLQDIISVLNAIF